MGRRPILALVVLALLLAQHAAHGHALSHLGQPRGEASLAEVPVPGLPAQCLPLHAPGCPLPAMPVALAAAVQRPAPPPAPPGLAPRGARIEARSHSPPLA